tara:strand:+ start:748 stop:975 length:228 start_codon:yes stop_codon:yes gene_type:complete
MQNSYFHNNRTSFVKENKRRLSQTHNLEKKKTVDINTLLNRVKIDERNKRKQQIIFFSSVILALGFFATFITLIQ